MGRCTRKKGGPQVIAAGRLLLSDEDADCIARLLIESEAEDACEVLSAPRATIEGEVTDGTA